MGTTLVYSARRMHASHPALS